MPPTTTLRRTPTPGRIGRYVVLGTAGEGGMGIVVQAHDPKLGRTVALKLLRTRTCSAARTRLFREAQALARLHHPNVVAVYDVDAHDGDTFVAMEFVDGRPLDRWLRARARSWSEIVRVFVQAGRGLAAAHAEGIVHRDFKPGNVIVGMDGRARVVDFGLACADPIAEMPAPSRLDLSGLTDHGMVVGTPAYMAPEQHFGEEIGPAADQFAFCVALWEALHGARPFAGWVGEELARAKVHGRITTRPSRHVPARIVAALRRGLRASPRQRWPSMHALLDAIGEKPPRRRPWIALALALGCVAASPPGELGGLLGDRSGDGHAQILRDEVRRVVGGDVLEAAIDVPHHGLVEHVLGPLHGERRIARDLSRQGEGGVVQRGLVGQHAVDEADAFSVGGIEVAAGEDELARDAGPDDVREPLQRAGVGHDRDPRLAHAEPRIRGREADVARGRDLEPAAEAIAVYRRDHGNAAALEARHRALHLADHPMQLRLPSTIGRTAARSDG